MHRLMYNFPKLFSFFVIISFFILACDNPVNDHGDHAEAEGFVLTSGGVEVVRYEGGEFNFNDGSPFVQDDQLFVEAGELTPLIRIEFLDHDGHEFTPEDSDLFLEWQILDENIAQIEQHSEDGRWSFHVRGIEAGETTIRFFLMHGDHSDFESLPMPVVVG